MEKRKRKKEKGKFKEEKNKKDALNHIRLASVVVSDVYCEAKWARPKNATRREGVCARLREQLKQALKAPNRI